MAPATPLTAVVTVALLTPSFFGAMLYGTAPAHAEFPANTWIAGDGNWNVATNWSQGTVPGPNYIARIANPAQVTINSSVSSPFGIQASSANQSAILGVVGGGKVAVIGESLFGTIDSNQSGVLVVTGAGSTFGSNVVVLGESGSNGAVQVLDGGVVNANRIVTDQAGISNLLVDGVASQLNSGDTAIDGRATVTVRNGGIANLGAVQVNQNSAGNFIMNIGTGGQAGTVTTSTGSFVNQLGAMTVLFNHTGTTTFTPALLEAGGTTYVVKEASGTTILTGNSSYSGGTIIQAGTLQLGNGGTSGSITGTVANSGILAVNRSDTFTFAGTISGGGAFAQIGAGTTVLTGANSYTGGTFLNTGTLSVSQDANLGGSSGGLTFNGGTLQNTTAFTTSRAIVLNPGGGTFQTVDNLSIGGIISGTGALTKTGSGVLNLAGANTYTGPTSVLAGALAVNGSITSNVAVGGGGVIAGAGTIFGNVVNGGVAAPGNSIGTLTVTGNFTQNGGAYQAEVNGAGQADHLNVGGTATLNGGAVRVVALPGTYRRNTTYTIVSAGGGVTGTYAGVTGNSAFLVPTLSYDANDVYLTLTVPQNAFYLAGFTPNQRAVGAVIDATFDTASGDYATVIGALTGLTAFQAPAALDAMSGQQYADFGTVNVNNSALFMNVLGQQMAAARGTTGGAQRQALAQACETDACEGAGPWTAWASALGGFGSVAGDYNASTVTYSLGGGAVGIDYRVDPRFLVGVGTAYTAGNMWVSTFLGRSTTDSVAVAAYGSFTQGGFYADLLGGYAYFNNQQQRQILVPGLQPRTASGSTGANQVLGQIETGYRFGIFAPAAATLTPFARLQGSSVTQNAFAEWGAQALSLNVSQQTTNSLRSTFGANLAGAIAIGDTRTLDLDLRLGWQHEYANTGRSITAALSGAPFAAFTVYGATPQRDAAVVGFSARTEVTDNTQLYLRYDGEIGSGTDNHAVSVGLRLSW